MNTTATALASLDQDTDSTRAGVVVCLCADWCGTCRDYRATFEAVAQSRGNLDFQWLDVEDDANRFSTLGLLDVESFPTLLFAQNHQVLFYGTALPHQATLTRMLEAYFPNMGAISERATSTHPALGASGGLDHAHAAELQTLLHELALTRQNGAA